MDMAAMNMVPVAVVVKFKFSLFDPSFVAAGVAMKVLMLFVGFNTCLMDMSTVVVMIVTIVLIIYMISVNL